MCTVDVVYGGGPDHQPRFVKLDGVPYDPDDLANLGREVIALERDLATERQRVADLERDLALERQKVAALRRLAVERVERAEQAEAALEALRARLGVLEAAAGAEC